MKNNGMSQDVRGFEFPPEPSFSEDLIHRCRETKDTMPLIYEWYKYVGLICNLAGSIHYDSPAMREISSVHYAVLTGLLNRCSRLMLSNVKLASDGLSGETTRLIGRCIAESALKVQWLCHKNSNESFRRYLADGLKKDLILKGEILHNISIRGGAPLVIEQRMLRSIDRCVDGSGLTEEQVKAAKKLPDVASMCRDLHVSRGFYTAVQRMGSHPIHGTWTDLVVHYLERNEKGGWQLRDHSIAPHENFFMFIALLVTGTVKVFVEYISTEADAIEPLRTICDKATEGILKTNELTKLEDFDEVV